MIKQLVPWPVKAMKQISGKLRRFFINRFKPNKVRKALALRLGNCIRCGTCCKILFKCPYLKYDSEGLAVCNTYEKRPLNCRQFPIDNRDIMERNFVRGVSVPCGFRFSSDEIAKPEKRHPSAAD